MMKKYPPVDFTDAEKLFRGFNVSDLIPDTNKLAVNSIGFPDFSCNWSRFSDPVDIRKRGNSDPSDGCYSFFVGVSRFRKMATPCHDPLESNYSHVEVRQLTTNEPTDFEPPKKRKLKSGNWSRSKRLLYRQNIINNMTIELEIYK